MGVMVVVILVVVAVLGGGGHVVAGKSPGVVRGAQGKSAAERAGLGMDWPVSEASRAGWQANPWQTGPGSPHASLWQSRSPPAPPLA